MIDLVIIWCIILTIISYCMVYLMKNYPKFGTPIVVKSFNDKQFYHQQGTKWYYPVNETTTKLINDIEWANNTLNAHNVISQGTESHTIAHDLLDKSMKSLIPHMYIH